MTLSAMNDSPFIEISEEKLSAFSPAKRQQALALLEDVRATQQSLCYHCKKFQGAVEKKNSSFLLGAVSIATGLSLIKASQLIGAHIHNDIDAFKAILGVAPISYFVGRYSPEGICEYIKAKKHMNVRARIANRRLEKINRTSIALMKDYGAKVQQRDCAPTVGFNELNPCHECVAIPDGAGFKSPALKAAINAFNEKETRPTKSRLAKLIPLLNKAP